VQTRPLERNSQSTVHFSLNERYTQTHHYLCRSAAAIVVTRENAVVFASATEEMGQGTAPITDHLPDFSLVIDRVCILLLAALAVFVPVLTMRGISFYLGAHSFLDIISFGIIGITCALPTTICVLKADGGAHTKWYWGEILTILGSFITFIVAIKSYYWDHDNLRLFAYSVILVSIAFASVRAMCRRDRAPGDHKRAALLVLTGLGQVSLYAGELNSVSVSLDSSLWSIGVMACTLLVVMMFWMDRKETIEHSVPYAVAYAWTLSASVLGASYILGLFYRFDTSINSVFGLLSTLVSQIVLTLFSTLMVWVFANVSGRITNVRDRTAFMFPGLFAVVDCTSTHEHTHTHTHKHTQIHTRAHAHTHTHTKKHTHTQAHTH
jgi:hypothetical protein